MAAPDSVTMRNYNGTFNLNKTLSDPLDPVLQMQGISWLMRKAIQVSNVTLEIKQYTDDHSQTHIDITSTSTGGLQNLETRLCDNTFRQKEDKIFGKIQGRTRFVTLAGITEEWLKQGWTVAQPEEEFVESCVESLGKGGWSALQIWGFETEGVGRRHVRRIVVRKGDEVRRVRVVYDWIEM